MVDQEYRCIKSLSSLTGSVAASSIMRLPLTYNAAYRLACPIETNNDDRELLLSVQRLPRVASAFKAALYLVRYSCSPLRRWYIVKLRAWVRSASRAPWSPRQAPSAFPLNHDHHGPRNVLHLRPTLICCPRSCIISTLHWSVFELRSIYNY